MTPAMLIKMILALLLMGIAVSSNAADHIVERAYFEDSSASLSWPQVQKERFTPFAGVFTRGFTRSAIWLRLRIDPRAGQQSGEQLILSIRPIYLDEVELFDPLQVSDTPRVTGDRHPWGTAEYRSLNLNFVIPRGEVTRDIWLRINTTSTTLSHVEALSPSETQTADLQQGLLYSILLAFQVLLMGWAASHWAAQRDRVVGAFAFKQMVSIIFSLAYMGYVRLFADTLPAGWLDRGFSLCIVAYPSALIWFDYQLLREYRPPQWGMRLLLCFIALLPLELVLILVDQVQPALRLNMLIVLGAPLVTLLLAIAARNPAPVKDWVAPVIPINVIVAFHVFVVLTLTIQVLPALGLMETFGLSHLNFLFHGLFNGILMVTILYVRARRMEAKQAEVQTALTISEQQSRRERQQRLEQSKFLSMLAHELKTPLSILRMVLGAKHSTPALTDEAARAIQDMNNVIERCVQVDKMEENPWQVSPQPMNVADELRALCESMRCGSRLQIQAADLTPIEADPKLLRILLSNLIDNADKYSPPHSSILVEVLAETRNGEAGVAFRISNQPGKAGWPEAHMLFRKYYRSAGAHEATGSGLGLYLVEHIARILGGQASYQPTATHIRFSLWIPA